ncbi:hypothetical protein FMUND_14340 [Fusarium mundagurra]|uniref:Uncharacterized protein n=1 Tax=Fusarium mundagurra TaxID=1567541 RepID=A0A8H5XUW2_9HYPO|nr:hypothetical protein FMUND_14340 [Fusarium mundagurra]
MKGTVTSDQKADDKVGRLFIFTQKPNPHRAISQEEPRANRFWTVSNEPQIMVPCERHQKFRHTQWRLSTDEHQRTRTPIDTGPTPNDDYKESFLMYLVG